MSYKEQLTLLSSLVKLTGEKIASFGFDPLEYSKSWPSYIWELDPQP